MTLFVDCDDTLVRWLDAYDQPLSGQNPYGGGSQRFSFNEPLIDAIKAALDDDPELQVVVWSGGGAQYALHWARSVFSGSSYESRVGAYSKDTRLPVEGDLCVDDQDLKVACPCVTAELYVSLSGR